MIKKILRVLGSLDYYLLSFFKNRIGLNNFDIERNGEKFVAQSMISLMDKPIIFDIGTNIGDWSRLALEANKDCKMFLFDANPDICKLLNAQFGDREVKITNTLVSNDHEEHNFFISNSNSLSGASSMYEHYYLKGKSKKVSVKSITIDTFCSDNNIQKIDYLKADIEGAEVPMLHGATEMLEKQAIDIIQLEYNQTWIRAHCCLKDIFDICKKYNYKLYRIMPNSLMILDYYHYIVDDFNYQNLLMVSAKTETPVRIVKNAMPPGVY